MTEHTPGDSAARIDVDPYADADGRIGETFTAEIGDVVSDLLADPAMWEWPAEDIADQVIDAISADAGEIVPEVVDRHDTPSGERAGWSPQMRPAIIGVVAAIVLLFGGVLALSALSGNPRQPDFTADLVPTGLLADVSGSVEVTARSSGLQIELDAPSLPRRAGGQFYEGWLLLDDGLLVPVGTFSEGDGVTLWGGIELERVVSLTITLADAGERGDTDRVVLKVDFPVG